MNFFLRHAFIKQTETCCDKMAHLKEWWESEHIGHYTGLSLYQKKLATFGQSKSKNNLIYLTVKLLFNKGVGVQALPQAGNVTLQDFTSFQERQQTVFRKEP